MTYTIFGLKHSDISVPRTMVVEAACLDDALTWFEETFQDSKVCLVLDAQQVKDFLKSGNRQYGMLHQTGSSGEV